MTSKEAACIILEYYKRFHDPKYLELDPLSIARQYHRSPDGELVALLSALFAFGGVKQIIKSLSRAIGHLELDVYREQKTSLFAFLKKSQDEMKLALSLEEKLKGFRHRVYVEKDLVMLVLLYRRSILKYGSLKDHFIAFHAPGAETIEQALAGVIAEYRAWSEEISYRPGRFFKHMLNSPEQKSACKRWVMFLKWMIRADDGIDLGLWSEDSHFRTSQLVIPLDTHLFRISKRLKLTKKKTANWQAALEVSRNLKKLDAEDPIKFDFALCRWGMLNYRKLL